MLEISPRQDSPKSGYILKTSFPKTVLNVFKISSKGHFYQHRLS